MNENEATKLLKQIAQDVRAIRRAVDPSWNGDEPRQTVRKKDPRALYGGG
jgi:hypothetical protein